jgi:3-oxoacyl-[acyl-carrier-protein] synthase-1
MGDAAAYAYVAMQNAITDAGLTPKEQVAKNPRVGVIAGSGGASTENVVLPLILPVKKALNVLALIWCHVP